MAFRYAAFTVMMPDHTIEESAALLSKLGYDGVEWRVHNNPIGSCNGKEFWRTNKATIDLATILEKAPEIRKLADDNGLATLGLGTYISYKHLNDLQRCMEAAKILGCDSVRVATPKYDGSTDYVDLFESTLDGFAKVEALARKHDVQANIEIHESNICCSASLAHRLVSNFEPDHVGVILDPGHMICQGYEGWQLGLELLGPYLSHVHVKNSMWVSAGTGKDGASLWKTEVAGIKGGFVNWRDVLLALDKVGFNGWLAIEDFSQADTETKLADGLAYFKAIEAEPSNGCS